MGRKSLSLVVAITALPWGALGAAEPDAAEVLATVSKTLWKNPRTLSPDRLAKNPRPAKFEPVDDKLTLTDGDKVGQLYRLRDVGHHDGTLIAYLPQQKILVQADACNPPAAPLTQTPAVINPYHQSLLANIERRGLDVQRIIPVHPPTDARQVTLAELQIAVGKQ